VSGTESDLGKSVPVTPAPHAISLKEATRAWAQIALTSFGGPAGQIAIMHRVLVEEKRWIGESRFLQALNFCMLLPGPEAQQLATYLGWLLHGVRGGLIAGVLFILPGAAAIMALSLIYAALGHVGLVQGLFFGLKAAVLAIVVDALLRIGRRALKTTPMRALAGAAFIGIFFLDLPFPLIILGAGFFGYLATRLGFGLDLNGAPGVSEPASALGEETPEHARASLPRALKTTAIWLTLWLTPVALPFLLRGQDDVFTQIAVFFSKMAVVGFGGAYGVLTYVAQTAVETYHWLTPGQMLDGLGMAETTPGPLLMVLQFVGFMAGFHQPGGLPPLLAGALAGLLATWVTFAPCFLWIFLGGPYVEKLRGNKALAGALTAITAAIAGVILNLAVWFALHTLFHEVARIDFAGLGLQIPVLRSLDVAALGLTLAAAVLIFRVKAGAIKTLAACAAAGMLLHFAGVG
jgi:chromate transporter